MTRHAWFRIVTITVAMVVGLAIAELGLRIQASRASDDQLQTALAKATPVPADGHARLVHLVRLSAQPRIVYELKPNLDVTFKRQRVRTSSSGFRDGELAHARTPNTRRVVGLGDSVMFGWGVGEGECYLEVAEKLLNQGNGPRLRWEILNTAVPGYNTVMEIETLIHRGLAYSPDIVILDIVGNDLDLPKFLHLPEDPWAPSRWLLAELVSNRLNVGDRQRSPGAELTWVPGPRAQQAGQLAIDIDTLPLLYRDMVGETAFFNALETLARLSREHDFDVVIMNLSPRPRRWPLEALERGKELGFTIVNLAPWLRRYRREHQAPALGPPLTIDPNDPHPTALVHAAAGRRLRAALDTLARNHDG